MLKKIPNSIVERNKPEVILLLYAGNNFIKNNKNINLMNSSIVTSKNKIKILAEWLSKEINILKKTRDTKPANIPKILDVINLSNIFKIFS